MALRSPGAWRRRGLRLALLWALALGSGPGNVARAQATHSDAAAKAKFTVTLSRYAQWPAVGATHPAEALRLCVLHDSVAVGTAFAAMDGSLVSGRRLVVVANPAATSVDCDVVFVDASAAHASRARLLATGAVRAAVLTIGAVDGFLALGGMIEVVTVNDTLRFDVNLPALRAAGLALSSQVLRLARLVRE
jgi:hypothetical protein